MLIGGNDIMVHTYPVKTVTENPCFLNGLQRGDFRGHQDSFWLRQNDVMRPMIPFKNIRIRLDEAPSFRFKIGLPYYRKLTLHEIKVLEINTT